MRLERIFRDEIGARRLRTTDHTSWEEGDGTGLGHKLFLPTPMKNSKNWSLLSKCLVVLAAIIQMGCSCNRIEPQDLLVPYERPTIVQKVEITTSNLFCGGELDLRYVRLECDTCTNRLQFKTIVIGNNKRYKVENRIFRGRDFDSRIFKDSFALCFENRTNTAVTYQLKSIVKSWGPETDTVRDTVSKSFSILPDNLDEGFNPARFAKYYGRFSDGRWDTVEVGRARQNTALQDQYRIYNYPTRACNEASSTVRGIAIRGFHGPYTHYFDFVQCGSTGIIKQLRDSLVIVSNNPDPQKLNQLFYFRGKKL